MCKLENIHPHGLMTILAVKILLKIQKLESLVSDGYKNYHMVTKILDIVYLIYLKSFKNEDNHVKCI